MVLVNRPAALVKRMSGRVARRLELAVAPNPVTSRAMRVQAGSSLGSSLVPSRVKEAGSRSGASSAVVRRRPVTMRGPTAGVTVKPELSLSKLRYLVRGLLSVPCQACWEAGLLVEAPTMRERGRVLRAGFGL